MNNLTLDATTGDNTTDKNTGGGSISTGSTNTNATVTNIANNTAIGGGGTIWMVLVNNMGTWTGQLFDTSNNSGAYSPFFTFTVSPDGSLAATNQNTGADSNNEAASSVDSETDITITNTATLTNNVTIDANTGGNSASKNTGDGAIKTGDVAVAANIMNVLNNIFLGGRFALTIVNIFGSFTGNIINGEAVGAITVDSTESIAISPNQTNSSAAPAILYYSSNLNLGSNNPNTDEDSEAALVLGTNRSDPLPTARFAADRGLLDDFKLIYLIFPAIFGVLFSLSRRALFKEVRR